MITFKDRERSLHVLLYALSEEKRIMQLPDAEYARRYKDCWDSCFEDMTPEQLEKYHKRSSFP